MCPFRRRPAVRLPDWSYEPVIGPRSVRFAAGHWYVTDGGISGETAVLIGECGEHEGEVSVELDSAGLDITTLRYRSESAPAFHEIVIDSGAIVIACEDRFKSASLTSRAACAALLDKAAPPTADCFAVSIVAQGLSVGIVIWPEFGDGVYLLNHQRNNGEHLLRIHAEHEDS